MALTWKRWLTTGVGCVALAGVLQTPLTENRGRAADSLSGRSVPSAPGSPVTVSLADFARGPGQEVHLPASRRGGLPIRVRGHGGLRSLEFALIHDPEMLEIRGVRDDAGTDSGNRVEIDLSAPGVAAIRLVRGLPPAVGEDPAIRLDAIVPASAPYRSKHRLRIRDVRVNGEAGVGTGALHLVAYPGDATGNAGYSALDAQRVLRLATGGTSLLEAFEGVDPAVVADIDGDGAVRRRDALLILREVVGLDPPEIPGLPGILEPILVEGPDPRVSIPADRTGRPGDSLTVPVTIDDGAGVEAVDLNIAFDPMALAVDVSTGVRVGPLMVDPGGLFLSRVDPARGTIAVGIAAVDPRGPGGGTLVDVDYRIQETVAAGPTPLNLVRASLNEDGLELTPNPTPAEDDEVDGRIRVLPRGTPFHRGDPNNDGDVDISDAIYILNFLFLGGRAPACRESADGNNDSRVDITDGIHLLNFLFLGGPEPPAPGPHTRPCGLVAPDDPVDLGCETYTSC